MKATKLEKQFIPMYFTFEESEVLYVSEILESNLELFYKTLLFLGPIEE